MFVFIPQLFLYMWRAAHHITQACRGLVFFRFRTQQYHLWFLYIWVQLFFSIFLLEMQFNIYSYKFVFIWPHAASYFSFVVLLLLHVDAASFKLNKICQTIISEFKIIKVICEWIETITSIMISYILVCRPQHCGFLVAPCGNALSWKFPFIAMQYIFLRRKDCLYSDCLVVQASRQYNHLVLLISSVFIVQASSHLSRK